MKRTIGAFSLTNTFSRSLSFLEKFNQGHLVSKNGKGQKVSDKFLNFLSIFKSKTFLLGLALLAIILIALLLGLGRRSSVSRSIPGFSDYQSVKKTAPIGKTFNFPIRDGNGKAISDELKMTMTTAELTKNILIKGKPATARDSKIFLILNLELDNPTTNQLGLAPVELIRLVDPSGKRYAPDIHNDKVTIEAISIKKTRVGFVVEENQSEWKIQVGEVNGPKETVEIKLS